MIRYGWKSGFADVTTSFREKVESATIISIVLETDSSKAMTFHRCL